MSGTESYLFTPARPTLSCKLYKTSPYNKEYQQITMIRKSKFYAHTFRNFLYTSVEHQVNYHFIMLAVLETENISYKMFYRFVGTVQRCILGITRSLLEIRTMCANKIYGKEKTLIAFLY